MTVFAKRLKSCREELKKSDSKWTQKYVADKIGVARVTYTAYENGTKMPAFDTINNIADLFGITTDYLMGRSEKNSVESEQTKLTEKDERDIAKDLQKIIDDLESGTSLAFDGEPMDDDTRELVLAQIERNLRTTKKHAKKKFTPKKYRDNK